MNDCSSKCYSICRGLYLFICPLLFPSQQNTISNSLLTYRFSLLDFLINAWMHLPTVKPATFSNTLLNKQTYDGPGSSTCCQGREHMQTDTAQANWETSLQICHIYKTSSPTWQHTKSSIRWQVQHLEKVLKRNALQEAHNTTEAISRGH